jgi:hypothetical protein
MGKIATTWELMKSSWRVLMQDKPLLLLPLISGIAGLLVLAMFILPFIGTGGGLRHTASPSVATYVVAFCYYLCNFFVIYFFNAALVDFVVTRLRGDEPTIGNSLREAAGCAPQIAMWAIAAATVGVVLQTIQSRAGFLGRLVAGLLGIAWTLVTFFVVPMIVIERKGAIEAISDSTAMVKKTWGQQVVSGVGYGLIGFLLTLPAIVIGVVLFIVLGASGAHSFAPYALVVVACMAWIIAVAVVMSALKAIFGVVLYLFAKTGKVPAGFAEQDLRNAIAAT